MKSNVYFWALPYLDLLLADTLMMSKKFWDGHNATKLKTSDRAIAKSKQRPYQ